MDQGIRHADLLDHQRNCSVAPGRQYFSGIANIGPTLAAWGDVLSNCQRGLNRSGQHQFSCGLKGSSVLTIRNDCGYRYAAVMVGLSLIKAARRQTEQRALVSNAGEIGRPGYSLDVHGGVVDAS
jgi:hypothetical protein